MTVRQDLTAANGRIGNSLIAGAGRLASQSFSALGNWRDDDVERYIRQIAPALSGIKRQAAKSTVAFYKAMAELTGQDWKQPVITASDLSTKELRNGVGTDLVYKRPFVDMRTVLSQGGTMTDAISAGARRAQSLAETEVQLARRNAGLKSRSANDRIVGYVRTLTGFENCALCYVASTQRYTRGDLMPIHPGCDCGEMPIYGTQDPGQVINEVRLEATHESIAKRFGVSARDAREIDYRAIKITDHGEMGPMLTIRGQSTQAAGDVGELFGKTRILGQLDDVEKASVSDYARSAYQEINAGQRAGWDIGPNNRYLGTATPEAIQAYKEQAELIDQAISKSAVAENTVVYRGARIPELVGKTKEQLVGLEFTEKGFSSTAALPFDKFMDESLSQFTAPGKTIFEISLKKGDRALDLVGSGLAQYDFEGELLLPSNTKFKIIDVIEKQSTWRDQVETNQVIQLEVVSDA